MHARIREGMLSGVALEVRSSPACLRACMHGPGDEGRRCMHACRDDTCCGLHLLWLTPAVAFWQLYRARGTALRMQRQAQRLRQLRQAWGGCCCCCCGALRWTWDARCENRD
jgi:hypothetical protein